MSVDSPGKYLTLYLLHAPPCSPDSFLHSFVFGAEPGARNGYLKEATQNTTTTRDSEDKGSETEPKQ